MTAPNYLVNCSILFGELPLLERPAAAAAAGFEAVEFWWPFSQAVPAAEDVELFAAAIEAAGVQLVGLNLAAGNMPAGDRGLLSWVGREDEFRASVEVAAGLGERLGVSVFNALYGNRLDGVDPEQQDALALDNLRFAAARLGGTVLLEPVSGAARYPLLCAADVVAVLDRADAPVRLLADLYHLAVNGDDVESVIGQHHERIGHVQLADAPGRHQPGSGRLDLDRHLAQLIGLGYSGWVGLEYVPEGSTLESLAWLPVDRRSRTAAAAGDGQR